MRRPSVLFLPLLMVLAAPSAFAKAADSWAFLESDNATSVRMSGSLKDLLRVKKLRKVGDPRAFWFQRGADAWLITDEATLKQVDAAFAPQAALDPRWKSLSAQMDAVTHRMEPIAREIGAGGKRVGKLARRLARLPADAAERPELEAELASIQAQLEERGRVLEAIQRDLEPLQAQAEKLQIEQDKAQVQVEANLTKVIEAAIRSGTAVRVK